MKALITGIEGFVGSYLTDELIKHNIDVYGTFFDERTLKDDLKFKASLSFMDITDIEQVKNIISKIQPDYIFHLAAQSSAAISWKSPQLTMTININGTINLMEEVRDLNLKTRIILIGSSEEYGIINELENPISEEQELRPGNPYSVSKITQEKLAELYIQSYDMDIVLTRSFNHTGNGQSTTFVLSDFAKKVAEIDLGQSKPIIKVGNLDAKRDFLDVKDVVKAYRIIALKGKTGEVYNVGSGIARSIKHYLEYMLTMTSKDINIEIDKNRLRPSDNPCIKCDNSKLKELGFNQSIDIYITISNMISCWKEKIKDKS